MQTPNESGILIGYIKRHEHQLALSGDRMESLIFALKSYLGDEFVEAFEFSQMAVAERRKLVERLREKDPELEEFMKSIRDWNSKRGFPKINGLCFPTQWLVNKMGGEGKAGKKNRLQFMVEEMGFLEEKAKSFLS